MRGRAEEREREREERVVSGGNACMPDWPKPVMRAHCGGIPQLPS
jgi:hypothetical protein